MSKLDDKVEFGLDVLTQMAGRNFADMARAHAESDNFGAEMGRQAIRNCFADAWGREGGLDRKSKSIAIIAAMIALRASAELRNHVRIGINHGLTVADFESLLMQLQPYIGVLATTHAMTEMMVTLREAGLIGDSKSVKERGLL